MKKIILYGSRLLSRIIVEDSMMFNNHSIAAVLVDPGYEIKLNTTIPIISLKDLRNDYSPESYDIVVLETAGKRTNELAQDCPNIDDDLSHRIIVLGYQLSNYISNNAVISPSATLGVNNVVLSGTTIGPGVTICDHNIIREGVYIGHDSFLGSSNFITSNSTIGGNCYLEGYSFVGLNSTVLNRIRIANHSVIGAGSVVTKDTEEYGKYVGNPARKINENNN